MKIALCIRKEYETLAGGDTIQLLKTKEFLQKKYNIGTSIVTDPEALNEQYDIAHIFNLYTFKETGAFFAKAGELKLKTALSTIFWDYQYSATRDVASWFHYAIPVAEWQSRMMLWFDNLSSLLINKPRVISKGYRDFCKQYIHEADLLLPNSMEEADVLLDFVGEDKEKFGKKIQVVYNATSFATGNEDENYFQSLHIPEQYVLQVGRIEYVKNQLNVVEALRDLQHIPIVFVGRSSEQKYFDRLQKKAQQRGNVFFIPQIPHQQLPVLFKKALLHILPSRRESPGLVSLEALSLGCKAVVSDNRFAPVDTYFKDHVTVINPNSTRSIRQGILHEMGASRNMDAIRQFVTSRFNWEVAATQTYEGYRQLLQKNTTV